jgi:hypothetical protein
MAKDVLMPSFWHLAFGAIWRSMDCNGCSNAEFLISVWRSMEGWSEFLTSVQWSMMGQVSWMTVYGVRYKNGPSFWMAVYIRMGRVSDWQSIQEWAEFLNDSLWSFNLGIWAEFPITVYGVQYKNGPSFWHQWWSRFLILVWRMAWMDCLGKASKDECWFTSGECWMGVLDGSSLKR